MRAFRLRPFRATAAYSIWTHMDLHGDVVVMDDWTTVDDRDPFIEVTKALPLATDAIDIPTSNLSSCEVLKPEAINFFPLLKSLLHSFKSSEVRKPP